jgi:putative nucleotidyltransferase with HDIG domain
MLKKISVDKAVTRMFVHQFCGSWIDHPFWSKQLFIEDEQVLRKIRESGVREIIIDLDRGVDVTHVETTSLDMLGENTSTVHAFDLEITSQTSQIESLPTNNDQSLSPQTTDDLHCSISEEIDRAQYLIARGKRDVIKMFTDVRMGRAIESAGLQLLVSDMSDSLMRNAHALLSLVRIKRRDEYTYLHSVAVAALMLALARSYGCDEETIRVAGMAGLLHDLGKVAMPDHILNKPGKLTAAEFDVMRGHPQAGADLLAAFADMPAEVLDACLHHHERMDGSGYPGNLVGEQNGLLARMAAICDVYDAVTSNRPYHSGWDPSISLSRMAKWEGHFDPGLFQLFVRTLGIYPVGSLVRLASNRLALVIEQNVGVLLKPRLLVFYSTDTRQRLPLETLDLSINDSDVITSREEPGTWDLAGLDRLWTDLGTAG